MERQLRQGGGIMDVVPREAALFGGLKKAIKKVTKVVYLVKQVQHFLIYLKQKRPLKKYQALKKL